MQTIATALRDVFIIESTKHGDKRGYFCETFRQEWLNNLGFSRAFVQENFSLSLQKNVLRGLHFQRGEAAQDKLVRCTAGSIFDVVVDIREGSPTYGKYVGEVLSANNVRQLLIPIGFAHGFLTLEDNCEVQYKCSSYYSAPDDSGLAWNDDDLKIDWPIGDVAPQLSDKDSRQPSLKTMQSAFVYSKVPFATKISRIGVAQR
jgi:dTDP-4-dehydrorhamnose 3,5-epimerase